MKKLVTVVGLLVLSSACKEVSVAEPISINKTDLVAYDAAIKTDVRKECACNLDPDGRIVWKFTIREKTLDGCDIDLDFKRRDQKVVTHAIKNFLGTKFDKDNLHIETKEFRNRLVVKVILNGYEIPNKDEDLTLNFRINGQLYTVHSKEYELVGDRWKRETDKNDEELVCGLGV